MSPIALKLAQALLVHHRNCCSALNTTPGRVDDYVVTRSLITYGQLRECAGVRIQPRNFGQFLDEVARCCQRNGWPSLAALVVTAKTGKPGTGYEDAPN